MNPPNHKTLKLCLISNSDQNYLHEYIELTRYDECEIINFDKLNLTQLKCYAPHIIIVDEYFSNNEYVSLIESIKLNFRSTKIYFLSPNYTSIEGVIQSKSCKNHYYSSFSLEILNHVNSIIGTSTDRNNYQEAG